MLSLEQQGVVCDPVHGVPLAIGPCPIDGPGHPQSGVLEKTRDRRARAADDVSHVFPAVLPIHVEEDRRTMREGPAGNVRQLSAGTFLLSVVEQPRAAPNGEPLRAQREASVVVALVAPLRRSERCPHLRDELHEAGQRGGLGPFLCGLAALRRERVLPCSEDVLERPDRHPHRIDQLQRGDPDAPVRATVVRKRPRPQEMAARLWIYHHIVVEDGVHCVVKPLRLPARLRVGRRRHIRLDGEQVSHLAPNVACDLRSPIGHQPVLRTIGGHPDFQDHGSAVHRRRTVHREGTHQLGEPIGYHQDEPVAGGSPSEVPIEVHRNVLEEHGSWKQGGRRAPHQGAHLLSCTAVALPNVRDDVCRHAHAEVIPPHRRAHAGLPAVPRDGRVVLEVKDLLLQEGRDHHLVGAGVGRAAAEDHIGVLEARDVASGVRGLHSLLVVSVRSLSGERRVTISVTDRGTANLVLGVEPPDRTGPSGEHRDGFIERRLVSGPGLQAGDAVRHVRRHPQILGDVIIQLIQVQAPARKAGVPRSRSVEDPAQAVVLGAQEEAVTLEVGADFERRSDDSQALLLRDIVGELIRCHPPADVRDGLKLYVILLLEKGGAHLRRARGRVEDVRSPASRECEDRRGQKGLLEPVERLLLQRRGGGK